MADEKFDIPKIVKILVENANWENDECLYFHSQGRVYDKIEIIDSVFEAFKRAF